MAGACRSPASPTEVMKAISSRNYLPFYTEKGKNTHPLEEEWCGHLITREGRIKPSVERRLNTPNSPKPVVADAHFTGMGHKSPAVMRLADCICLIMLFKTPKPKISPPGPCSGVGFW